MTTFTESQLLHHAARKSGRLGEDENLSAEGYELFQRIARSRVRGLQARGVDVWGYVTTAVPEEYLDPIAEYLAMFMLAAGGGPKPTDVEIQQAELIIRQLGTKPGTGAVVTAEYF